MTSGAMCPKKTYSKKMPAMMASGMPSARRAPSSTSASPAVATARSAKVGSPGRSAMLSANTDKYIAAQTPSAASAQSCAGMRSRGEDLRIG